MTRRRRVSKWLADELHYQGNTRRIDCTPLWIDRLELCGTTPYHHGVCDVFPPEERR
jgi:hypothetical protein